MIEGRPSASCFYIAPGIDQGDIVARRWLPSLPLDAFSGEQDLPTLYRLVYSFIDPWVRAFVLSELLESGPPDYSRLNATTQGAEEGRTFHSMHRRVQAAVFGSGL